MPTATVSASDPAPLSDRARRFAGTVLAAVALLVVGCGDDELDPSVPQGRPAEVKWGDPAGEFAGKPPRGVLLLLHGGGWKPDPAGFEFELQIAPVYQRLGYATGVIAYGAGERGVRDVEKLYAEATKRYPRTPVCAVGVSAGGHLALLLATREPGLDCVIDVSGPTDLEALADQEGGEGAHDLAVDAFGESALARNSPIADADSIKAEVMLVFAEEDPVVPEEQGEEMAEALPDAELIVLPAGDAAFVHGPGVDAAAKAEADQAQLRFLERVTG